MATPRNPMQPAVSSPYGNRGTSLPNPTPPESIALDQRQANAQSAQGIESVQAPQGGLTPPPMDAGQIAPDPALGQETIPQDVGEVPQTAEDLLAMFAAERDGGSSELPTPEQIAEAPDETPQPQQPVPNTDLPGLSPDELKAHKERFTRFREAFAQHPDESMQVLRESGVFEDVRKTRSGAIEVKRPGEDWEDLDRSLVTARDLFTLSAEWAGRGAGALIGAAAAPFTGGASIPAGSVVGGTIAALAAENTADLFAQVALGIDRSPERNFLTENAIRAGLAATFGKAGKIFSNWQAGKKLARESATGIVERAQNLAQGAAEDINQVNNLGIKYNLNTGKLTLDPQQSVGSEIIPDLNATAQDLGTLPEFQNFRQRVGEQIQEVYDGVTKSLGAIIRGSNIDDLGKDFTFDSKEVRKVVGKQIGDFRRLVDDKVAGQTHVTPQTWQTIDTMFNSTLDSKTGKPTVEMVQDMFPGLERDQAQQFIRHISDVRQAVADGGLSLDAAIKFERRISNLVTSGFSGGSRGRSIAESLKPVQDSLRSDISSIMENSLSPQQAAQYAEQVSKYRKIMEATRNVGNLMNENGLSKDAFLDRITKGGVSYDRLKNVKTLMDEANPELWNQTVEGFFQKMRNDSLSFSKIVKRGEEGVSDGVINWGKMHRTWNKLDERIRKEFTNTLGMEASDMNAIMRVGQRIQNVADFNALPTPEKVSLAKTAMTFAVGDALAWGRLRLNTGRSLLEGMGHNQAVMKWLKDGGVEEVIKKMPALKPGARDRIRSFITSWQPNNEVYQRVAPQILDASLTGAEFLANPATVQSTGIRRRATETQNRMRSSAPDFLRPE